MGTDVVFFQHGNFAKAYQQLGGGGDETYRDQRRSVDYVADMAKRMRVTVVSFVDQPYDVQLELGLRAIGVKLELLDRSSMRALFDDLDPRLVICRAPHIKVLREVSRRRLFMLPCFADIFSNTSLRKALHNFRLRLSLHGARTPCFANHSLNASRSMRSALRYSGNKIVPWDWSRVPLGGEAKPELKRHGALAVFFAGALTENKGVGDCLEALAILRREGLDASMTFAGPGGIDAWKTRAVRLGLGDAADFVGMISNADVRRRMREHDVVVVPSRHGYAEGLPNTIYEALASRSPLVISDHPAFQGRVMPETECLVYGAAKPAALAKALARLAAEPALYRGLSENSVQALDRLYVGMEWERLIEAFIEDPENRTGWVQVNSLTALGV
jgi:glycosyltransferase involved in cell wall biosynthesis